MTEHLIPAHPRTYALFVNANDGKPDPPYVFVAPIIGWAVRRLDGDWYGDPMYQLDGAAVESDYSVTVCGCPYTTFSTDEVESFIVARIANAIAYVGIERLRSALLEPNEWLRALWPKIVAAAEEIEL